jgi:hypothetical protein
MNQRIQELTEQAREKKFDYRAREGESHYIYVLNEKKFAELIVAECGVALAPMLRDMISRGQAYDMIRQHFGVE